MGPPHTLFTGCSPTKSADILGGHTSSTAKTAPDDAEGAQRATDGVEPASSDTGKVASTSGRIHEWKPSRR